MIIITNNKEQLKTWSIKMLETHGFLKKWDQRDHKVKISLEVMQMFVI